MRAIWLLLAAQTAPPALWFDVATGPERPVSISAAIDAGDFVLLDVRSEDPHAGSALWRTDGTERGTMLVTRYSAREEQTAAFGGARAGGYVVFGLADETRRGRGVVDVRYRAAPRRRSAPCPHCQVSS